MPSHQPNVSEFVLAALKEKVVENFNSPITSKTDCDKLSESVEAQTGRLISVNTLRRFFEVMPNDGKPSINTLNILTQFCGFTDFLISKNQLVRKILAKNNCHYL